LILPACNRAIELAPDNGLYYNSRGIVYLKLDQDAQAAEDFKTFEAWLAENEAAE
jgi:Flp pilus assembly protein TadD